MVRRALALLPFTSLLPGNPHRPSARRPPPRTSFRPQFEIMEPRLTMAAEVDVNAVARTVPTVYEHTIVLTLHGFYPGAITAGKEDMPAKELERHQMIVKELQNIGHNVESMRFGWNSFLSAQAPAHDLANEITHFLDGPEGRPYQWNLYVTAFSRGVELADETLKLLSSWQHRFDAVQVVYIDPTTLNSFPAWDSYPTEVPSWVDQAMVYRDGISLDTLVSQARCFSQLVSLEVPAAKSVSAVFFALSLTAADAQGHIITDERPIGHTEDHVVTPYKTDFLRVLNPLNPIDSHMKMSEWYNNSQWRDDLRRFLRLPAFLLTPAAPGKGAVDRIIGQLAEPEAPDTPQVIEDYIDRVAALDRRPAPKLPAYPAYHTGRGEVRIPQGDPDIYLERTGGTVSGRAYNPALLPLTVYSLRHGAIGGDEVAIFRTYADGVQAAISVLDKFFACLPSDMTLADYVRNNVSELRGDVGRVLDQLRQHSVNVNTLARQMSNQDIERFVRLTDAYVNGFRQSAIRQERVDDRGFFEKFIDAVRDFWKDNGKYVIQVVRAVIHLGLQPPGMGESFSARVNTVDILGTVRPSPAELLAEVADDELTSLASDVGRLARI